MRRAVFITLLLALPALAQVESRDLDDPGAPQQESSNQSDARNQEETEEQTAAQEEEDTETQPVVTPRPSESEESRGNDNESVAAFWVIVPGN